MGYKMIIDGYSQILGVGSFFPDTSVQSSDLLEDLHADARFGLASSWMDEALGIKSRRFCDETIRPSDISTIAAIAALKDAGVEPQELTAIIYCGITGDFIGGVPHINVINRASPSPLRTRGLLLLQGCRSRAASGPCLTNRSRNLDAVRWFPSSHSLCCLYPSIIDLLKTDALHFLDFPVNSI